MYFLFTLKSIQLIPPKPSRSPRLRRHLSVPLISALFGPALIASYSVAATQGQQSTTSTATATITLRIYPHGASPSIESSLKVGPGGQPMAALCYRYTSRSKTSGSKILDAPLPLLGAHCQHHTTIGEFPFRSSQKTLLVSPI